MAAAAGPRRELPAPEIIWSALQKHNSFRVRQPNGVEFTREPGTLAFRARFCESGLAQPNALGARTDAKTGASSVVVKSAVLAAKSPKKGFAETKLGKPQGAVAFDGPRVAKTLRRVIKNAHVGGDKLVLDAVTRGIKTARVGGRRLRLQSNKLVVRHRDARTGKRVQFDFSPTEKKKKDVPPQMEADNAEDEDMPALE